jgi:hypothetical protein
MNPLSLLVLSATLLFAFSHAMAACSATPFKLRVDRTTYVPGEAPRYTIEGAAPGMPITWSSWKDGASSGEVNANYGQVTNGAGGWSAVGGAWTTSHRGLWVKEATICGAKARMHFYVAGALTELQTTTPPAWKDFVGVSHWGPARRMTAEHSYVEGAKLAENAGAQQIFLAMSPRFSDYPGASFGTPANLTDFAKSAPVQQVFTMPFKTFVLVTYSFTNWAWINAHPLSNFDATRAANERAELYQLAKYLIQTYRGTGKTFIIKNWEGDWALRGNYDLSTDPNPNAVSAYRSWLAARQAGIMQARQELSALTGVSVKHAIEFNAFSNARAARPSVLHSIVPAVASDMISYSSWETCGPPTTTELRRRLLDDIALIKRFPGVNGRALLISEFGWSEKVIPDTWQRFTIAANAYRDAGTAGAYFWELLDDTENTGRWLIRGDWSRTPGWTQLRSWVGASNNARFVSQSVPPAMEPGKKYSITVTLTNNGTLPWNDASLYRLGSQNPGDTVRWGVSRVVLPSSMTVVRPGQNHTFSFTVTAPTTPATYAMQWRMVQDAVEWFGDLTPNLAIRVAANKAPAVNAGADTTARTATPITLSGTVTDDNLPNPPNRVTYQWAMVSGPAAVVFSSPTARATNATFNTKGSYSIRLSASDGVLSGSDSLVVTVTTSTATSSLSATSETQRSTIISVDSPPVITP